MSIIIRNAKKDDIDVLTYIIKNSFYDVAKKFSLTIENAPTHPSNCTNEWIITASSGPTTFSTSRTRRRF
ncbi:MAG: hypothetical protein ACFFAO_03990 [Candidatus Hermodarchaeota archaeon]